MSDELTKRADAHLLAEITRRLFAMAKAEHVDERFYLYIHGMPSVFLLELSRYADCVLQDFVQEWDIKHKRERGIVPADECVAAECNTCGKIWTTEADTQCAPVRNGWPTVKACGWCFLSASLHPVPHPSYPGEKPSRGPVDQGKLN